MTLSFVTLYNSNSKHKAHTIRHILFPYNVWINVFLTCNHRPPIKQLCIKPSCFLRENSEAYLEPCRKSATEVYLPLTISTKKAKKIKKILFKNSRGVFRTQLNIYDGYVPLGSKYVLEFLKRIFITAGMSRQATHHAGDDFMSTCSVDIYLPEKLNKYQISKLNIEKSSTQRFSCNLFDWPNLNGWKRCK